MFSIPRSSRIFLLLLAVSLEGFIATSSFAQVQTGTPPFGSTAGGPDAIDLSNLNIHLTVPIFHKPGRGTDFNYYLGYDSSVWYPVTSGSITTWTPTAQFGWTGFNPTMSGYVTRQTTTRTCRFFQETQWITESYTWVSTFVYVDPLGTSHNMSGGYSPDPAPDCGAQNTSVLSTTKDGSGYQLLEPGDTLYMPNGSVVALSGGTYTDRNGNLISQSGGTFTDTLGKTALTVTGSGTAASPYVLTYTTSTGGSAHYTINYTNFTVATNFGVSNISEYKSSAAVPLITSIVLPDNSQYTFTYENTPGTCTPDSGSTSCVSARIKTVTFPTGATITYGYSGGNNGIFSDGTTATLSRQTPDGTWTYAQTKGTAPASTTTVTDPTSGQNQTAIQFQGIYETQRKIYQGSTSGTLLQTINTCYNAAAAPCTATAITLPITQRTVTATIPGSGNLQSKNTQKFDSTYGNLIETDEYDFSSTSSFTLLRQTLITYVNIGSYMSLPSTTKVLDGSGYIKSRQDTGYDSYGSGMTCVTTAPQHNNTSYGCTFTARGNATSTTTYTDPITPSGATTRTITYDSTGNLLTAQLSCCQLKTWAYSIATDFAYPDSVTSGTSPQLTTSMTYDLNMGLLLSSKDPNNITTTMTYDNMGRTVSSQTGSLPATNYTYTDSGSWSAKVCAPVQGSNTACQNTVLDSLGRTKTAQLLDGSGTLYYATDTQYDNIGRAYKASNPYTTSPSYWTQVAFDVLGRVTSTTYADGSVSSISYSDNTTTSTDPAGKQRKGVSDGLGRLSSVYEPDPSQSNSLTLQTSYTYNVFNELTGVTQGSQTRTYTYDALGRLTSSSTPEAGTVCIGTVSGGMCQANTGYDGWGNKTSRTDARGVVTTYLYDTLNRLVGVAYPTVPSGVAPMPMNCKVNGSSTNNANVCFAYGTSATSYNNGRIISMYDAIGSETYTYDQYGNVTQLAKAVGSSTTFNINYTYNLANELTQITYPSGRAVAHNLDTIGRLSSVVGTLNSVQTTYASGFLYNTAQQTTGFKYGNNLYASLAFSPDILLLNCLDYSTTNRSACAHDASTKFGLNYSFPASPGNNGQVASITDAVDNGRSATYLYDSLYRLTSVITTGSTAYPKWGLSETYDRYGNRLQQATISGQGCTGITCPTNSVTVSTTTNHITSPYTYDSSGNMTNDGLNTLTYDGENRNTAVSNGSSSGSYSYDGRGVRVQKTAIVNSTQTTTVYIFSGAKVLAEYDNGALPTSPSREYVYSDGTLLAKVDSSGAKYYHQDQLSNRLVTNSSGTTIEQLGHFPFGESWYDSTNDKLLFTSYERDAESLNDYAFARYSVNRLGRFSSPDQFGGTVGNPQSLNRYTYALNDPCNLGDPLGLSPTPCKFNVAINNANRLTADQLKAAETEINRILGAMDSGLSAQFNVGKADFSVNLTDFQPTWWAATFDGATDQTYGKNNQHWWNFGALNNSANIYLNTIQKRLTHVDTGLASGRVIAHEFGHWALQIEDVLINPPPLNRGVMERGDAPILNPNVTFDPSAIPQLQALCSKQHPQSPSGGGGSSSGQGFGGDLGGTMPFWWWEFVYFDYYTVDTSQTIEVVTHQIGP